MFNRGRLDAALDSYVDPEVEVEYHGIRLDAHATYHGHAGVRAVVAEFQESFPDYRAEVEEFIDAGEDVVVAVHYSGHGKISGIEADLRVGQVWTVRDSKLVRWRIYRSKAEALEAVGLRE
jgi:ketosteroid isomerase-like protein